MSGTVFEKVPDTFVAPVSISDVPDEGRKELARLGAELRRELKKHYVYKDNKGRIGNFFLPACAVVTSQIDSTIARFVPQLSEHCFEEIRSFNISFSRASIDDGGAGNDDE